MQRIPQGKELSKFVWCSEDGILLPHSWCCMAHFLSLSLSRQEHWLGIGRACQYICRMILRVNGITGMKILWNYRNMIKSSESLEIGIREWVEEVGWVESYSNTVRESSRHRSTRWEAAKEETGFFLLLVILGPAICHPASASGTPIASPCNSTAKWKEALHFTLRRLITILAKQIVYGQFSLRSFAFPLQNHVRNSTQQRSQRQQHRFYCCSSNLGHLPPPLGRVLGWRWNQRALLVEYFLVYLFLGSRSLACFLVCASWKELDSTRLDSPWSISSSERPINQALENHDLQLK